MDYYFLGTEVTAWNDEGAVFSLVRLNNISDTITFRYQAPHSALGSGEREKFKRQPRKKCTAYDDALRTLNTTVFIVKAGKVIVAQLHRVV